MRLEFVRMSLKNVMFKNVKSRIGTVKTSKIFFGGQQGKAFAVTFARPGKA